jgi:mersacidin/lichenicidin family type 2 lantibiotic
VDIIRAWKDPEYRRSLDSEFAGTAAHPAGMVRLEDDVLDGIGGGTTSVPCATTTITVSIKWCSPDGTFCGTCAFATAGCC